MNNFLLEEQLKGERLSILSEFTAVSRFMMDNNSSEQTSCEDD